MLVKKKANLTENWDNLLKRLLSLLRTAETLNNAELRAKIAKNVAVMKKNDPSNKIYSSILAFADNVSSTLNKGSRER